MGHGILAVDPGGAHVGWAVLVGGNLTSGEVAPDSFYVFLDTLVASDIEVFIYEGFRVRDLSALIGDRITTIEMIGAIKDWARRHEATDRLVEQLPSMKQGWSDKQLLKHAVPRLPRSGHARDAIRHLCHYMAKHGRLQEVRNAVYYFA